MLDSRGYIQGPSEATDTLLILRTTMCADGLLLCTMHISLTSRESHRPEFHHGNDTDLHIHLRMVGHGSGGDDRATSVLQPKHACHNRQRTIYALIGRMFRPVGRMFQPAGVLPLYGGLNRMPMQTVG
jgi:hypothetical protein